MFWLFDHICIRQYLMELHCVANLTGDRHLHMYIFGRVQSLYLYTCSYNICCSVYNIYAFDKCVFVCGKAPDSAPERYSYGRFDRLCARLLGDVYGVYGRACNADND